MPLQVLHRQLEHPEALVHGVRPQTGRPRLEHPPKLLIVVGGSFAQCRHVRLGHDSSAGYVGEGLATPLHSPTRPRQNPRPCALSVYNTATVVRLVVVHPPDTVGRSLCARNRRGKSNNPASDLQIFRCPLPRKRRPFQEKARSPPRCQPLGQKLQRHLPSCTETQGLGRCWACVRGMPDGPQRPACA